MGLFCSLLFLCGKQVKVKGRALVIAPQVDTATSESEALIVHGAHQAASHIPALDLSSRSRYSFTDPKGWKVE